MSKILLKVLLILIGVVVTVLGINGAFGGIPTLGLQGSTDFFTITDQSAFDVRDSHVRFSAGVLIAIGLMMIASAKYLQQMTPVLIAIAFMFFVGGLSRLSAMDFNLVFSASILPSLLTELFGFPLLAYWATREKIKAFAE